MTDKTMTLDGVRDDLECLGYKGYADVITRHLSQTAERGEAVAWMRPSSEGYDSAFRDASTVERCKEGNWVSEGWIPLYTAPPPAAGVPDDVVERLAKHIYAKEARSCKTLDEAVFHRSHWRRAIPEAREMLEAAMLPATPSPTIDVAAVAWAWKSDGMTGWALGHVKPTPENTHQFHDAQYGCSTAGIRRREMKMLEDLEDVVRLSDRLDQLVKSIVAHDFGDFSMRVPAEHDRDADLVLSRVSTFIRTHHATIRDLATENAALRESLAKHTDRVCELTERLEAAERDERQCLPDGWSIEVREKAGKLGLCVFGPTGGFSVDCDTNHSSEIRGEVIAALHAAMQEAGR